jgi:hypothetical protein
MLKARPLVLSFVSTRAALHSNHHRMVHHHGRSKPSRLRETGLSSIQQSRRRVGVAVALAS